MAGKKGVVSKKLSTTREDKLDNFVNTYLLTFNLKTTAKNLGISMASASHMYKTDYVQKHIDIRKAQVAQRCDVTVEECLNELHRIAFFDHKDYLENFKVDPESGDFGATLKAFEEMDTRALQEISCKINSQGIPFLQIKPYSKIEALKELLNRIQGTNGDKHLHLHLNEDEMKDLSTKDATAAYQQLVEKASK